MSTTIRIQNFSEGIAEDIRTNNSSKYAIAKHFDTFAFDRKLQPHRSWEADETFDAGAKTDILARFLIDGENGVLYGYGKDAGSSNQPKLYKKTSADITTNWTPVSGGTTATSGVRDVNMFSYYQGNLHGWRGNRYLWQFDISTGTFTDSKLTATASWTTATDGLAHQQAATLYFGHDNFISQIKDGTATEKVLTLSQDHYVADLDQKGIYLLAALAPSNNSGSSYLAIWDTADGTATPVPQESIDIGNGIVHYVANVDGTIVVAMTTGSSSYSNDRLVIKQLSGSEFIEVASVDLDDLSTAPVNNTKSYDGSTVLFPVQSSTNTENTGVLRIGKSKVTGRIVVAFDRRLAVTSIEGLYASRGIVWLGHSGDGSIERTNDGAVYDNSLTCIYESLVNQDMKPLDREELKKLQNITVNTEPLPSNGTITVKYKTEHDTTWQTFSPSVTNSTNNAVVTEFTPNIRAFYDIQFRIESVGGAVPTGFSYRYDKWAGK